MIDLADPGCASLADNDESDGTSQCQDKKDNDQDSLVDLADPGCLSASDNDESDGTTQCQDLKDNDNDGLIDSKDPGCSSPTDTNEGDEAALLTVGAECVTINADKTMTAYFSYNNLTQGDLNVTTNAAASTTNEFRGSTVDATIASPPVLFKKGISKGGASVTFSGGFITWVVRAPKSAESRATVTAATPRCGAVTATAECRQFKSGIMRVTLGYNNPNAFEQKIPIGALNRFSGTSADRGQPNVFFAGLNKSVFEVALTQPDETLVWELNGVVSSVSSATDTCDGGCSSTPTGTVTGNLDKVAGDLSTLMNRAADLLVSVTTKKTDGQRSRDQRDADRAKRKAAQYQTLAKTLSIQFPEVVKTCPEAPAYCVTVDRQGTIDALRGLYANQRNSVMRIVARTFWRQTSSTKRDDGLVKQAKTLEQQGLTELGKLPRFETQCK